MRKRLILMFCTVLCMAQAAFAQNRTSQVVYNQTTYNFGKIKEVDGPVSCTFEYTNTDTKPYIIDFVSVSCGCTTPEYSKAPLMPGEKAKMGITYDPSGRPGAFNKSIVVTSNNRNDQVTLTITGEVIGKPRSIEDDFPVVLSSGLRANSSSFLFGYLARGRKATQSVDIYNSGSATLALDTKITSGDARICNITITPASLKPKERGQISFTYNLTAANVWGLVNTAFVITVGGRPTPETFNAYATVTEDFSLLSPEEMSRSARADFSSQFYHFGDVNRSEVLTREFTITNSGDSPLYIRSIKPNSQQITYSIDKTVLKTGERATLKVTLKNPEPGRVSESITIILNDPQRPMREIRLAAVVN